MVTTYLPGDSLASSRDRRGGGVWERFVLLSRNRTHYIVFTDDHNCLMEKKETLKTSDVRIAFA